MTDWTLRLWERLLNWLWRIEMSTLQKALGRQAEPGASQPVIDLGWRSGMSPFSLRGFGQHSHAWWNQWPLTSCSHRSLSGHTLITVGEIANSNLVLWNSLHCNTDYVGICLWIIVLLFIDKKKTTHSKATMENKVDKHANKSPNHFN